MSRWHNQQLDSHAHFCTATVSRWRPLLVGEATSVIYAAWEAARGLLGVGVLAYVIMPSHLHTVLWCEEGMKVRRFLQRTLSVTSKALEPDARFWKERPRVLAIYSQEVLETKVDYLHANPVRRGLVSSPADWPHSSYRQIEQGLTEVPFVCDGWERVTA
jgi:putative transposase